VKDNKRVLAGAIAALAVLILTLTACGSSDDGSTSAATGTQGGGGNAPASLKVGFDSPQAYTNNMPVLIAIDQGFFKKRGLDVTTVGFNGGSDAVKALIGGSIDVQAGVGFDVVGAQAKGLKVKGFFGIAQDSDFGFFANPDSGVSSFADLDGKSAAISAFGSYTDYLTKQIAAQNDLSEDAIKEVPLGTTPAIVGAVTSNKVAGTWEPAFLEGLFKGKAQNIGSPKDLGVPSQYSTLLAKEDYLADNGDAIRRFNEAIAEAIEWHATHQKEAIALAVKQLEVPEPVAAAGYDAAKAVYTPSGEMNPAGFESMAQAVPALKLGPKAPATDDLYTTEYLPAS
jgi:NitT/TauT family transport system substrate-binding protein